MCDLEDHDFDNNLSWEIYKNASHDQRGSKSFDPCLTEKVSIIYANPDTLLNKKAKLICKFEINFCKPTLRNNYPCMDGF